jgi:hypothetical protein
VPKLIDPPRSPEAVEELERFVREKSLEVQTEFKSHGRQPGSKNKKPKNKPENARTSRNTRNYRARKGPAIAIVSPYDGEEIPVEPGVRWGPPWKRR